MKKAVRQTCACLGMGLLAAVCFAAEPGALEQWDEGLLQDWTREDPLNSRTDTLTNPTNYLRIVFREQEQPFPEVHIVTADGESSGGAFTGTYWNVAITNVRFKVYCETHLPADLRLYFKSAANGDWWYYYLDDPVVGEWKQYEVSMKSDIGWSTSDGAGLVRFKEALQDVAWVGVLFERNSSVDEQIYGLDAFAIDGASRELDIDNDGSSDWYEFMAGTDPGDADSVFEVLPGETGVSGDGWPTIRWQSARGRLYKVYRSTNLLEGFELLEDMIPPTPPENVYIDETATEKGPYYYKVTVQ